MYYKEFMRILNLLVESDNTDFKEAYACVVIESLFAWEDEYDRPQDENVVNEYKEDLKNLHNILIDYGITYEELLNVDINTFEYSVHANRIIDLFFPKVRKMLLLEYLKGRKPDNCVFVESNSLNENKKKRIYALKTHITKNDKQDILDCINEIISLGNFSVEKRRLKRMIDGYPLATYSKSEVAEFFNDFKVDDVFIECRNNTSDGAKGLVYIITVDADVVREKFYTVTPYGWYFKVIFEDIHEDPHSRNGLEASGKPPRLHIDTLKVKIEFISAHDAEKETKKPSKKN